MLIPLYLSVMVILRVVSILYNMMLTKRSSLQPLWYSADKPLIELDFIFFSICLLLLLTYDGCFCLSVLCANKNVHYAPENTIILLLSGMAKFSANLRNFFKPHNFFYYSSWQMPVVCGQMLYKHLVTFMSLLFSILVVYFMFRTDHNHTYH